jgi:hypothetical protein
MREEVVVESSVPDGQAAMQERPRCRTLRLAAPVMEPLCFSRKLDEYALLE